VNRKTLYGLVLLLAPLLLLAVYFGRPYLQKKRIARLEAQAQQLFASGELIDAELALRKALELDAADPELHFQLGQVLEKEGVLDQARDQYLEAGKARKIPDALYNAGVMAFKLSDQAGAEKTFRENLRSWPEHVPTLYQLGWLTARTGKCPEAIPYFEKIITAAPGEAEAYNNLGYCYYLLDQLEPARDMFKKALELKPDFESAKKSLETVEQDLAAPASEQPGSTAEPPSPR
jgi:Flp pilus assembly protein TadD